MSNSDTNTASAQKAPLQNHSAPRFSNVAKALVGTVVFAMLLLAMVVGAGLFDGKSSDVQQGDADRSPQVRADLAIDQGDWPVVAEASREMLQEDPFDARSIFFLAYSLRKQNQLDESEAWFNKALDFHRYRLWSRYSLACINALQDEPVEALSDLELALQGGYTTRRGIEFDKDLAKIKDEPEFLRLIELEKEVREEKRRR